jgi:D-isomer specific 2-hydroxyacid dehydrogenase, NAD binding domain
VPAASQTQQGVPGHRHQPHDGPLRVLVGKERFSADHPWSEMPEHWPDGVAGRAVIEVVGQGQLEARLADGGPPVDVVVPLWSPLPGRAIRAGSFGLVQQFGVGVDNIARGALLDTDAALAHLSTGHLAGLGLDVFPTEPYPADGPLVTHPRILATAHTASLTSDYFAAASRRLGDALARYLHHQPPSGLLG